MCNGHSARNGNSSNADEDNCSMAVFMILVTVMTMLRELMQAIVITKARVMRTVIFSPFSKPL